jgi:hypothetical protein
MTTHYSTPPSWRRAVLGMLWALLALGIVGCTESTPIVPGPNGEVFRPTPSNEVALDIDVLPRELPRNPEGPFPIYPTPVIPADPTLGQPLIPPLRPAPPPPVDEPAPPETPTPTPEEPAPAEPNIPPMQPPRVNPPLPEAPTPPAEPEFAPIALHPGATFDYGWRLDTRDGTHEGTLRLRLGEAGVDAPVGQLGGGRVMMYPVEMLGNVPPGFRFHEVLGAIDNVLLGGRTVDGNLEIVVLFDPNDGGYAVEHGFSALLPLCDQHHFIFGPTHDGHATYLGVTVWASEKAVEYYRSGIGFSGLDVEGWIHLPDFAPIRPVYDDAHAPPEDMLDEPGHLRMVLVDSTLLP